MKMNFTRKVLDALRAPAGTPRVYYHDTRVRGLALAVSPSGRKTFLLYRKIRGRPERITIGAYPDLSIEQARGRASEMNAAIVRGENPAERQRAVRNEMTLEELFQQYIERHAKVFKKSWREDLHQFRRYLHGWRLHRLSSIRKGDIATLHAKVGRAHGPYAANRLVALLRTLFNKAADWGWEGTNPATGIGKFRERSRDRFLQADELPAFFKALGEEPNATIRDYILISLLTGARRSNVLALRWSELNLNRGTWTIPETKTGDSFTVTLPTPAIRVLQGRAENASSEWVFPGNGRTGHLVEPKIAWHRILKRADLKDLRLHDLRRTLGSWQAATGASLSIIGKTLAHKDVRTTAIYARLSLDPVRESVETATRAMLEAGAAVRAKGGTRADHGVLALLPAVREMSGTPRNTQTRVKGARHGS
jgi:integrase